MKELINAARDIEKATKGRDSIYWGCIAHAVSVSDYRTAAAIYNHMGRDCRERLITPIQKTPAIKGQATRVFWTGKTRIV